ncbi:zeta toxin family protein [Pseudomonas syringae pv. coryli]|uniref:zeta toxin family protein n=1 Tax=Pseudomonas syringae pv. coryli TaxID=317659 RepID=UPI003D2D83C2
MANRFQLSKDEHDEIYRLIESRYLPKSRPQDHPTAIITGGQPGSGKSGITTQAKSELAERGGYVLIDADKLRTFSPLYRPALEANDREAANLTHPDAAGWSKSLTVAGAQGRRNLIIDQTSKDPAAVEHLASQLKGAGYRVELRVMAVNEKISEQRIHTRYEEQKAIQGHGRFSTAENHQIAYAGVAKTVSQVEQNRSVDALVLMDKNHIRVSENFLENGEWSRPMSATRTMEAERSRPLTLDERKEIADQYVTLSEMVNKPERGASPEQRQALESLRDSSRADLDSMTLKVGQFAAAATAAPSSNYIDAVVSRGTVIEVEQRHVALQQNTSPDLMRATAKADLQDFDFLAGKPEQLAVASHIRPMLADPDYRDAISENAPTDFLETLDAAQLVNDQLESSYELDRSQDIEL